MSFFFRSISLLFFSHHYGEVYFFALFSVALLVIDRALFFSFLLLDFLNIHAPR